MHPYNANGNNSSIHILHTAHTNKHLVLLKHLALRKTMCRSPGTPGPVFSQSSPSHWQTWPPSRPVSAALSAPGVGDFESHTWRPKGENLSEECLLKLLLKTQCLFDMLKDTRKLLGYFLSCLWAVLGHLQTWILRIIINKKIYILVYLV
jgi:hypothetical protein